MEHGQNTTFHFFPRTEKPFYPVVGLPLAPTQKLPIYRSSEQKHIMIGWYWFIIQYC